MRVFGPTAAIPSNSMEGAALHCRLVFKQTSTTTEDKMETLWSVPHASELPDSWCFYPLMTGMLSEGRGTIGVDTEQRQPTTLPSPERHLSFKNLPEVRRQTGSCML